MKKLMTLLGITAFALGAFADLPSGTGFENYPTGEFNYTATDSGSTGAGVKYWATAQEGVEASVVEYDGDGYSCARPAQFDGQENAKYLKIDTTPSTLYRAMNAIDGVDLVPSAIEGSSIGDGLYIDTMVQFTVSGDPRTEAPEAGTKLAIWAETDDSVDNSPTNFVVWAGYGTDNTPTNYTMVTPANFVWGDWHRLTLKAIANIGNSKPGFVVFVDGAPLVRADPSGIGFEPGNKVDAKFTAAVLPSMVASGENVGTLSAIGFNGDGKVDDISFTSVAPDFAADASFYSAVAGAGVSSVVCGEYPLIAIPLSEQTIVVTYTDGYSPSAPGVDGNATVIASTTSGNVVTYTVTGAAAGDVITFSGFQPVVTVDVAGTVTPYATIGAAFDAVVLNGGTVALVSDVQAVANKGLRLTKNVNVVLDLAGHKITGASGDYVLAVDAGSLIVTNSTVDVGEIDASAGSGVWASGGGITKIYGGKFTGSFDYDGDDYIYDALEIYGGQFDVGSWGAKEDLEEVAEDTVSGPTVGYYTVGGEPAETYDFTITAIEHTTYTWTVDGVSEALLVGLTNGTEVVVTYTAAPGYKITDATAAAAEKTYTINGDDGATDQAVEVEASPYAGTDYEPWAYSSKIVVWRATSGQLFHASTVAEVDEYGQIGESYTLTQGGAHPWQIFASNQSAYSAPGATLVFDEAGYNNNSDAQFAPMSFGGMWVKALQADNTPYFITNGNTTSDRTVELGAANANTYFKFDESFTFDRSSATKVLGTATVEIASGKTFTINARANTGAVVDADSTLILKGAGSLAVVGGLNVSGTLDLSAATVPTIDGYVTLNAGSTIILPAGTETGSAINVAVCSETLAASGLINVQIGDADAVQALLTVSGGAITKIEVGATYTATVDGDTTFSAIEWQKGGEAAELPGNLALAALEISGSGTVTGLSDVPASVTLASGVTLDVTAIASSFADLTKSSAGTYMFTDNYPLSVPQGYTYEYVGGSTEAETATISGDRFNNSGNLKTSGYLAIDDFWTAWTTASLEVLDGKTTVGANNDKALRGTVTIRASAELVNAKATDALAYGATTVVNVYGTLSMGETRWTVGGSNTINVYGGTITGVGEGTNGALDFMDTSSLNADETSEISASIRFRNALTSVTVAENKTLTLSGVIRCQYAGGGVTKQGKGNLTFTTAPNALQAGIVHKDGHLVFNTQDDVTLTVTYNTAKTDSTSLWYATQSNWKGTVKIDSLTGNLSWLTGAGNADSTISMQNVSNAYVMAAVNTTYSLPGTLSIDAPVEFNNGSSGSTVNITNLAGSSTLVLGAWGGCSSARYNLLNVDVDNGWTGTLVVSNGITRGGGGTFTVGIGNIETANTTPGRCVLPITNVELEGHTGTVAYNIDNATLNGNPASFEVKTDGIYVAEPPQTVTVTVPGVDNTTVTVEVGGETIGTAAGDYVVDAGATVTITYAVDAAYEHTSGELVYTIENAEEGSTITPSIVTTQYLAKIDGGASYTTLQAAIDATALSNSKVVLVANESAGATVPSVHGKMFYFYDAGFEHGEILDATGNFITTATEEPTSIGGENVTATKYRVVSAFMAVTISGTRTLYGEASANDALTAANAGPLGTTVEFFSGDPASYAAYLPMFTYNEQTGIYTKTLEPVAAVYSGVQQVSVHTSLADAIAAAEDGLTVKLLANVTLGARVEPNKSMTIDLGGYTLSRTGTSGNGSVFDVKSGNVVITNGVINCTQDDTAIAEDGVYAITARNGANVTLGGLTVTVNSECGACVYPFSGATVTILSGTYANITTTPYRWKPAWTGMALNQRNKKDDGGVLTQRITVYGGSFKQVDPTLGDDSWADGEGTFLASGYAATWNSSTGYYDVAEVQEVPVVPGQQTDPVDTAEAAAEIAAKTVVSIDQDVAAGLTTEQQTAYKDLFEAKVVEVEDGGDTKYAVAVELKDAVAANLQTNVDGEAEDLAAAAVAAAANPSAGGTADVATVAGLYYIVEAGTGINNIVPVSCTLATGDATELAVPNKGTSGFYRLRVSVTPVDIPNE